MGRLSVAIQLFFRILRDPATAERARALLGPAQPGAKPSATATPAPAPAAPAAAPARSDALTLLAVLQREARLIDFLKEDIAPYQDAQIGAAVRDVHRDARAALDRCFALRPVLDQAEGSDVALSAAPDAARIRLTGNPGATPPPRGQLRHAGWQAAQVSLPQYTGTRDAANIIAPAEVEV